MAFHSTSLSLQNKPPRRIGTVNKEVRPLERQAFRLGCLNSESNSHFSSGLSGLHLRFRSVILSLLASRVIPEAGNRVSVVGKALLMLTGWATQDPENVMDLKINVSRT